MKKFFYVLSAIPLLIELYRVYLFHSFAFWKIQNEANVLFIFETIVLIGLTMFGFFLLKENGKTNKAIVIVLCLFALMLLDKGIILYRHHGFQWY